MPRCGTQVIFCDLPIRFDTYKGCSHGCNYCFAYRKKSISRIEKDEGVSSLKRFIEGKRNIETKWCDWEIPLHWGGMSDPFQPVEKKVRNSYECLKVFAKTKYPFIVSTKGELIADKEYLELLKECNCIVQISAVCSKYDRLEKGAPPFEKRLEMIEKISKIKKKIIVRIQPYMPEVKNDVLHNLEIFKKKGATGITIEGIKFFRKKPGLVKYGADYVYKKEILLKDFLEIKNKCKELKLEFYCAENRLRQLGDSLCCCGAENTFKTNKYNLLHAKYDKENFLPRPAMKKKATAYCFKAFKQTTNFNEWIKEKSFDEIMKKVLDIKEGEEL